MKPFARLATFLVDRRELWRTIEDTRDENTALAAMCQVNADLIADLREQARGATALAARVAELEQFISVVTISDTEGNR